MIAQAREIIYINWRLSRGPCAGGGTDHGKRPEENYGRYVDIYIIYTGTADPHIKGG